MCNHPDFCAFVTVNRIEDTGEFSADIRILCAVCGTPFRFLGLPIGLRFDGAAASFDGTEARMAIIPVSIDSVKDTKEAPGDDGYPFNKPLCKCDLKD